LEVRKSLLGLMLTELLETRVMLPNSPIAIRWECDHVRAYVPEN
jgi:hypothetical protein